jgi:hypothetical protein
VKAAHPNITIFYWDDMLDPWHLHAPDSDQDNLQAQHYGREDGVSQMSLISLND